MTRTWGEGVPPPAPRSLKVTDWLRITRRGVPFALTTFGCLIVLLLVRLIERPLFGMRRPWTPHITQFVCRMAFVWMGMRRRVTGAPMHHDGAIVANHSSWLDIFTLNASKRIYFVSKAEVAGWPGIGWLARATGTVFIRRDRREAAAQARLFEQRLLAGHKLLFFPEGTSTDGRRVLPFNPTLFAAFFAPKLRTATHIQPVSVVYSAPDGADPRFYGWWGDMEFGAHLLQVLAMPRNGAVDVVYHPPLAVADFGDRKALAAACEACVRSGLESRLGAET